MNPAKIIAAVLAVGILAGIGTVASAEPVAAEATGAAQEIPDDPMAAYLSAYEPVFETIRAYYSGEEMPGSTSGYGDNIFSTYYISYGDWGIGRYPIDFGAGRTDIGYLLQDISGDGIPELIIGDMRTHNESEKYLDGIIYDMFTLQNGSPKQVLASSARSRFRLFPDNLILSDGSGGASSQITALYRFNGTNKEFVYALMMQKPYYYEVTTERQNIWQPAEGDTMLSEGEYQAKNAEMFANVLHLELAPLSGAIGTDGSMESENEENNYLQYEGFWVNGSDLGSDGGFPYFVNMLALAFQDSSHLLFQFWMYRAYSTGDPISVDFDQSTGVGTFERDGVSGTIMLADNHVTLHMEFGGRYLYQTQDITFDKYSDNPDTNPIVGIYHSISEYY